MSGDIDGTVLDGLRIGLGGPGRNTVEAAEGYDPPLPLQLGEQRRRCHAARKLASGPDDTHLRASRPRTTIAELQHVTVLAQTATSALGLTT
ncbi:hypothetical protein GTZ89_44500 [Streptomyces sp. SID8382]|uniref:hypothetical protein n=1 Tax=Streptomyces malaysiensis TaxID=92644 RepID=UPI000CA110A3|nr:MULTISPECIES: hypothetical protein [unclassified Streptomyces]AUA07966.1 hypothetical protein CFP59_00051 [Streptomyces sp. M56]MYX62481.1 hypothetical protein [Streptomyces sp. SID8382]